MWFAVLGALCIGTVANGQEIQHCGGNLGEPSGDVSSPKYPDEYDPFLRCEWTIPSRGGSVTVTFKNFTIEDPDTFLFFSSCDFDYVEIIVGDRSRGRYCGTDMPPPFTATEDVKILFVTDQRISGPGFHFSYIVQHALDSAGPCGRHLDGTYGEVTSPNFPNNYPDNLDCTWTIPSNIYGTTVTFTDFLLEDGGFFSGCPYDYVEIFEGRDSIGTYCGADIPPRIATTKEVRIKFETDGNTVDQGFKFKYLVVVPPSTAKPDQTTKPEGSGDGSGDIFI